MMGAGRARHRCIGAALLAALPAGAAACTRVVEAVRPEGCAAQPATPGCSPITWPTPGHSANSDPWIVEHHDAIAQMSPRVLVLNFSNSLTVDTVRQTAERQAAAIAEGSRYHGYSNSSAPVFLTYQIAWVVDLADHPIPAGWTNPSSTLLPLTTAGEFDSLALFSASFSPRYGFADPAAPARSLSLCELFEQGFINEVWIEDGEGQQRHAPYNAERKQIYDAQNKAVANSFAPCVGRGGCLQDVDCSVTVRMAHLDSRQPGAGCDLYVRAWSLEGIWDALPAFAPEGNAFVNRDFRTRFGLTFNSWDNICDLQSTKCVDYPTPTSASGTDANGIPWTIPQFIQGCGTASFPPNARARYDYQQTMPVQSRCEHFGLHDGPDGKDALEAYTAARIASFDAAFRGCGDGWQIYLRQSIPGRDNHATTATGLPMRNWWPLLFY
jgi:hypothetical protein